MPNVCLIQLPYDCGRFEERMGRGPRALIKAGLVGLLRAGGFDVDVTSVQLADEFRCEAEVLVELQRRCTALLRECMRAGARPILLSGNCGPAALSAVSAIGSGAGAVWFDAHGDFNTPETSASGFLDGMALALVTGRCWGRLLERLETFKPIAPQRIVQIGVRDTDAEEETNLSKSGITRIRPDDLSQLPNALAQLADWPLYVHIDADVLDRAEGDANTFASAGGLSLEQLKEALTLIIRRAPVAVASITAYDPAADVDGRIKRALLEIVQLLASG